LLSRSRDESLATISGNAELVGDATGNQGELVGPFTRALR
jgi:hypothetical protein